MQTFSLMSGLTQHLVLFGTYRVKMNNNYRCNVCDAYIGSKDRGCWNCGEGYGQRPWNADCEVKTVKPCKYCQEREDCTICPDRCDPNDCPTCMEECFGAGGCEEKKVNNIYVVSIQFVSGDSQDFYFNFTPNITDVMKSMKRAELLEEEIMSFEMHVGSVCTKQ